MSSERTGKTKQSGRLPSHGYVPGRARPCPRCVTISCWTRFSRTKKTEVDLSKLNPVSGDNNIAIMMFNPS